MTVAHVVIAAIGGLAIGFFVAYMIFESWGNGRLQNFHKLKPGRTYEILGFATFDMDFDVVFVREVGKKDPRFYELTSNITGREYIQEGLCRFFTIRSQMKRINGVEYEFRDLIVMNHPADSLSGTPSEVVL